MEKNLQNFSMEDALRLANSPAGQQLLALIRRSSGDRLSQAQQLASEGNSQDAAALLAPLLSDPEAQAILSQLRGDLHGGA